MRGASTSPYWQHRDPIRCPKKHVMVWLGSVYWICSSCKTVYVQVKEGWDAPKQRATAETDR